MFLAPLASVILLLLEFPLLLAALSLVVYILLGGLRGMGIPRLFWHERALHRFVAGAAVTLLAAEVFLVAWLLRDGRPLWPRGLDLPGFGAWASGAWAGLMLLCALLRASHDRAIASGAGSPATYAVRITPTIRTPGSKPVTARAPVGLFLAGVVAGGMVAWALVFGIRPIGAPWAAPIAELVPKAAADPLAHLSAFLGAVLMVIAWAVLRRRATPAVGISFLIALVVSVYGALLFFLGSSTLAWLALIVGLTIGGLRMHKLRIRDLNVDYRTPKPYPPPHASASPTPAPLPWDQLCSTWTNGGPRALVLVCVSGGGLRSATWTAGILGRLTSIEGFCAATRLLTGASGGMVGAAAWIASLRVPHPPSGSDLCRAVGELDALTDVARTMVFEDLPRAFWPGESAWNRGEALSSVMERRLKERLGVEMATPFGELRDLEGRGGLPSLLFSPMMVEDGRRFLIGNLDLSPVTDHRVLWLSSEESGAQPLEGLASRTAYHASRLFPERWGSIRLSTAARLSAAFPYVSPAAVLPTLARRRVVDAGYFDNYGLELACGWLEKLLAERFEWLKTQVSRVLVVQIRDNVSELSVNPETDVEASRVRQREASLALQRGLEGITSPPEGLLAARDSVMLFRNDAQLEGTRSLFRLAGFAPNSLMTTIFEFKGEASLSWTLSADEVEAIREQVVSPGISSKLDAIRTWLAPARTGPGLG